MEPLTNNLTNQELIESIKFNPTFYLLDTKENRVIAIEKEVENGYNGIAISIDSSGVNTSPIFIASTFINNSYDGYELTKNNQTVLNFLNNGK